jgi:hypothetical protein
LTTDGWIFTSFDVEVLRWHTGGRIAAEALLRGCGVIAVVREGSRLDRGDGRVTRRSCGLKNAPLAGLALPGGVAPVDVSVERWVPRPPTLTFWVEGEVIGHR